MKTKYTIKRKYRKRLEQRLRNEERHGIPRWKKEAQKEKDRLQELDRQMMNLKYLQHDWTDDD